MERTKQGEFAWTDLSAKDLDGQTAFYEGLFGWEHRDVPMGPDSIYRMFTLRGNSVCGASQMLPSMMEQGAPSAWNVYIAVDDVAASLARAVELGAQVAMPETDISPTSRFAAIVDPTGAALFLWNNSTPDETQTYLEPGTLAWNDLVTRDPEKAADFFTKLVGWQITLMDQGPTPYWQVSVDGVGEGGIMPMPEMIPPEVPAYWLDYFGTADIAATVAKAKSLGASVLAEPMEAAGMIMFAVLEDPAGVSFALMQPLATM